jgi:aerobic-type carbon monoxide dehydrogenase small subunit (CoxS/CutS family)
MVGLTAAARGKFRRSKDCRGRVYTAAMPAYKVRINGVTHEIAGEPDDSLLSVLRYELDLTGSKFGCGEGACGACTVLVDNQATRSCVTRLAAVAGKSVTTIEGLSAPASLKLRGTTRLHPVQQAFLDAEAFQCGYCTPGMVMATVSLLRTNPAPSEADIARVMDRNVCRCGTYPRIVRAVKLAAERMRTTESQDLSAEGRSAKVEGRR